jgi:hypothetical protein
MANKWLMHVKKTMKTMKAKGTYKKGEGLKQVIKAAKATYHKHKGGADGDDEEKEDEVKEEGEVEGGRRRRRTRRRSRKSMY